MQDIAENTNSYLSDGCVLILLIPDFLQLLLLELCLQAQSFTLSPSYFPLFSICLGLISLQNRLSSDGRSLTAQLHAFE